MSLLFIWGCSSTNEQEDSASTSSSSTSSKSKSTKQEPPMKPASEQEISELSKAFDSKQYKKMLDIAGQILLKNPDDANALNTIALYHTQRGEWGAAKLLLERALEKNKDVAGLYNNLGVIALREDNLELAYVHFKTAYSKQSNNPNAIHNLGSIYVMYLDYGRGEKLAESAYSSLPESVSVANNLAIIRRSQGKFEEAEGLYKKILDKDSRNVSTLLNYAILLIEYMKKYNEGEKLLNKLEFLESSEKYVRNKITELNSKVQAARR